MYRDFNERKRDFISLEKTGSTNSDLKKMIAKESFPLFCVLSADVQTEGRGRLGRSFFSPDGGLYFSFTLPLSGKEENIPFITLLAGLATSEAIEKLTGVKTEIKWPNDIYINGKKLGGILCELVSGKSLTAVVGVGINLNITENEIPAEIKNRLTSFFIEKICPPEKNELCRLIVEKTDSYIYEGLELFSVSEKTLSKIRESSFSTGKKAVFSSDGAAVEGFVTQITPRGSIELQLSDGTVKEIFTGEIVQ